MIKYHITAWLSVSAFCVWFGRVECHANSQPDPMKISQFLEIREPYIPPPPPPDGALGGRCSQSSDCVASNSACVDETCECMDGYVQQGENTCIQRLLLDDPCESTLQCPANAVCNTNCVCDSGSGYLKIVSQCLPVLSVGDECQYDLQCSTGITNSECDTQTPRVCSCTGDLQEAADGSCVPGTISLRMEQGLDDSYTVGMATVGSADYNPILAKVESIYQGVEGYISLDEFTVEDNGAGKALAKFLLKVTNSELSSHRFRRDTENIVNKVKDYAMMQGHDTIYIVVKLEKGRLHDYCITDEDCGVVGSTCRQSVCTCAFGSIADGFGGAICKKSSFY